MRRNHYATEPDFTFYDWDALFDRLAGRTPDTRKEAR
jgi:hypothetical protein